MDTIFVFLELTMVSISTLLWAPPRAVFVGALFIGTSLCRVQVVATLVMVFTVSYIEMCVSNFSKIYISKSMANSGDDHPPESTGQLLKLSLPKTLQSILVFRL